MWVLFRTEQLNIRALSEKMQVSRRSVQNDVDVVQEELEKYGMVLEYDKGFHLTGESEKTYNIRSMELAEQVRFLDRRKRHTAYEKYMGQMLEEMFLPIH